MAKPSQLRVGILGAAQIAHLFCAALKTSELASVVAIGSRDEEKARRFASTFEIPRAYGTYEAVLRDAEVEAVYIPLPNHLHSEWAIRAAEAGKHILCEKPLATSVRDAKAMFAAARANGVMLVEGYPFMAQRQTLRVRELVAEKAIGRVLMVIARFSYPFCTVEGAPLVDPSDIRFDPARGGGALLDVGTYAMAMIRIATGARPNRVVASSITGPSGIDQTSLATLEFPSGVLGQLSCSYASGQSRFARIIGDDGEIETSYLNHQRTRVPLLLRVKRGGSEDAVFENIEVPGGDGFELETESFARAIRSGSHHWTGASEAESLDIAESLDAIAESARTGRPVTL